MKAVVVLLALLAVAYADNWAVLIAGSNGFWNYRHQSDICHSFQILKKNGVNPANIIVMQYDDIASSSQNPFKGKVFNKPTPAGTPGVDVYAGCNKDYTGADVTAQNFINVLTGVSTGGKKVLKSGPNDNVFIYFSDHGAVGLIAMPTGNPLYSTQLIEALKTMHTKNMYKKLVFYLEACESGSMFDKVLPSNIGVYATTAANPSESSWGWYCSPDDKVEGKSVGSCLGDEYSVRWMEDSDRAAAESLQQQFIAVQKATVKSHVMQYGDMSFNADSIWEFQGKGKSAPRAVPLIPGEEGKPSYGVNSRDIKLHYLYNKYTNEQSNAAASELQAEIKSRANADALFTNLARTVMGVEYQTVMTAKPSGVCDEKCCQPAVNAVYAKCGGFTDYSLKYVRSIVNMCASGDNTEVMSNYIQASLADLCA